MFAHDDFYMPSANNSICKEELSDILLDYQREYASNPTRLRQQIPSEEMWRFFVDGCDQHHFWPAVEARENGYFKAMFTGFNEIFSPSAELTQEFILKIHKLSMTNVDKTNYVNHCGEHSLPGEYRSKNLNGHGCFFNDKDLTLAGLQERFARPPHRYDGILIEYDDFGTRCKVLFVSNKTIARLRMHRDSLKDAVNLSNKSLVKIVSQYADFAYINYIDKSQHAVDEMIELTRKLFYKLSLTTNDADIAEALYFLITSREYTDNQYSFMSYSMQSEKNPTEELGNEMQRLIKKYNRSLQHAKAPIEKLSVIVQFIQSSERLHPFYDGNGRTFCTHLLNFLLIKNGFPLVIMDNPNHFDTYSATELLREVIKGMRTTLMLNKNCPIYTIITSIENETLAKQSPLPLQVFNSWVALEEANRERWPTKVI